MWLDHNIGLALKKYVRKPEEEGAAMKELPKVLVKAGRYEFMLVARGFDSLAMGQQLAEACLTSATKSVQRQPAKRLRVLASSMGQSEITSEQEDAFDAVQSAIDKACVEVFKSKGIFNLQKPAPQVHIEQVG